MICVKMSTIIIMSSIERRTMGKLINEVGTPVLIIIAMRIADMISNPVNSIEQATNLSFNRFFAKPLLAIKYNKAKRIIREIRKGIRPGPTSG